MFQSRGPVEKIHVHGSGTPVALLFVMNPHDPDSIGALAKGIAVRAGILSVVSVVAGAWIFGLAAKAASGAVKIAAGVFLLTAGAGLATWEVKRAKRHFGRAAV
jgi:hypothetical protein